MDLSAPIENNKRLDLASKPARRSPNERALFGALAGLSGGHGSRPGPRGHGARNLAGLAIWHLHAIRTRGLPPEHNFRCCCCCGGNFFFGDRGSAKCVLVRSAIVAIAQTTKETATRIEIFLGASPASYNTGFLHCSRQNAELSFQPLQKRGGHTLRAATRALAAGARPCFMAPAHRAIHERTHESAHWKV